MLQAFVGGMDSLCQHPYKAQQKDLSISVSGYYERQLLRGRLPFFRMQFVQHMPACIRKCKILYRSPLVWLFMQRKLFQSVMWGVLAWTRSCAACCRWPCFARRVGLDDPQRSLPTPTILWFCDSVMHLLPLQHPAEWLYHFTESQNGQGWQGPLWVI